jgi:hypothetical protein
MKSIPFLPRYILAYAAVALSVLCALPAKAIGPDVYGYTAVSIPYNFDDLTAVGINSTAVLDMADDDAVTIPIGFDFVFYGKLYTSISITTNGTLTFVAPDDDWTPVNITTTSPADDRPMILPFWHDWDFKYNQSDSVYYAIFGSAPNRRLVIQWEAADDRNSAISTDTVTFEAKIFEGSNNIEFHYQDATVSDDLTDSNGRHSTVGIRDSGAQTNHRVLQWLFNQPNLTDESGIRFTAPQFKMNSITRTTLKDTSLDCFGVPSSANFIEFTDNLVTTPFAKFQASAGADSTGHFTYIDSTARTSTHRFYRVSIPQ